MSLPKYLVVLSHFHLMEALYDFAWHIQFPESLLSTEPLLSKIRVAEHKP
jgi:hypothetical protein